MAIGRIVHSSKGVVTKLKDQHHCFLLIKKGNFLSRTAHWRTQFIQCRSRTGRTGQTFNEGPFKESVKHLWLWDSSTVEPVENCGVQVVKNTSYPQKLKPFLREQTATTGNGNKRPSAANPPCWHCLLLLERPLWMLGSSGDHCCLVGGNSLLSRFDCVHCKPQSLPGFNSAPSGRNNVTPSGQTSVSTSGLRQDCVFLSYCDYERCSRTRRRC